MPKQRTSIPSYASLRAFEAVARLESFVLAADDLNVSISAVSHQVAALEANLNTQLLRRARGRHERTTATPAGRKLMRAVALAQDHLAEACDDIRTRPRQRARRTIVVSGNAPFCSLWLAPKVARFASRRKDLVIRVIAVENTPNLAEQRIDIAIVRVRKEAAESDFNGDDETAFLNEVVFPVCSPIIVDKFPGLKNKVSALASVPLLQEENTRSPELDWETWLGLLNVPQHPAPSVARYSGFGIVVGAAIGDGGVALGRSPLIDEEVRKGRLVRLFPKYEMDGSWKFVIRTSQRAKRDPAVQSVFEFLTEEAARSLSPKLVASKKGKLG
jgi:LysR family glycine cleavage system transcriptional activator